MSARKSELPGVRECDALRRSQCWWIESSWPAEPCSIGMTPSCALFRTRRLLERQRKRRHHESVVLPRPFAIVRKDELFGEEAAHFRPPHHPRLRRDVDAERRAVSYERRREAGDDVHLLRIG